MYAHEQAVRIKGDMKVIRFLLLFASLFFFTVEVIADSILCIPEIAVGIKEYPNKPFELLNIDVSQTKFLITKKDGIWQFGYFGDNELNYIPCVTEFMCTCGDKAWCGHLMRSNKSNIFTYYVETGSGNGITTSQVIKGKCSRI